MVRTERGKMRVIISGLEESSNDKTVNINNLIGLIKNMKDYSPEIQNTIINKINKEYIELWDYICEAKDNDRKYMELYYLFLPYFSSMNLPTLISKNTDEVLLKNGLMSGQLYTITAPSGRGKTAFCIMLTACLIMGINPYYDESLKDKKRRKVIYISLEQNEVEIEKRIISTISGLNNIKKAVSFSDLMNPSRFTNTENYKMAIDLFTIFNDNLRIVTSEDLNDNLTIDNIYLKLMEINEVFETDLVIIDQFDNITGLDFVSMDVPIKIKDMAQRMNVPVVLQAQMNKGAIAKAQLPNGCIDSNKISANSLKGTSALEHQSSSIIAITQTNEKKGFSGYDAIKIKLTQLKARYGSCDSCEMWHVGALNLFLDELPTDKEGEINV